MNRLGLAKISLLLLFLIFASAATTWLYSSHPKLWFRPDFPPDIGTAEAAQALELEWATTTNAGGTEVANAIAIDSSSIYVGGYENNANWRIEKRSITDGSLVYVVSSSPGTTDRIHALAIDSSSMYIAGYQNGNDWRLEKRALFDGTLTYSTTSNTGFGDFAFALAIDSSSMYVAGYQQSNNGDWRIEKRSLVTGDVIYATTSNPGRIDIALDIAIDSSSMYVVGYESSTDWRVEKRSLSNGGLIFATTSNPGATDQARSVAIDASYMYVVGNKGNGADADWYIEKRSLSNGAIIFATTSNPGVQDIPYDVAVDSENMYIVGREGGAAYVGWRIEIRSLSTGELIYATSTDPGSSDEAYSVKVDDSYMYVTGIQNNSDWRIEKRALRAITEIALSTSGTQTSTIVIGSQDAYIGAAFLLNADAPTTIDTITLTDTGTVNANQNLTNVQLWYEEESCGNQGSWVFFGSGSFDENERAEISGTMPLASSPMCVHATFDVGSGARHGETIEFEIADPESHITGSDTLLFSPASTVSLPGTTVLTDYLLISATGTQTATVYQSSSANYLDGAFTLSKSSTSTIDLYQITISDVGSVTSSQDLANFRLRYEYAPTSTCAWNGNETTYGIASFNSSEKAVFSGSLNISSTMACLYLETDVLASAPAGKTIDVQVADPENDIKAGTLSLVHMFSTSTDFENETDTAHGVAVDSSSMYVVGYWQSGDLNWAIQKRSLSDGMLLFSTTSEPSTGGDVARAIAIDSSSMYIAGYDSTNGSYRWRVEKRSLADSAIYYAQTYDAGVGSHRAFDIAIDSSSMYVVGDQNISRWRIEKRLLSNGSSLYGVTSNPTGNYDGAFAIDIDDTHMYVVGIQNNSNWRIEKRLLSNGSSVYGTSSVAGIARDIAIDSTHMYVVGDGWYIEKRLLSNGSLVYATTTGTGGNAYAISIDSSSMYIAGGQSSEGWRLEKRSLADGMLIRAVTSSASWDYAYDIAIDSTYSYTVGLGTSGSNDWYIEKRTLGSDNEIYPTSTVGINGITTILQAAASSGYMISPVYDTQNSSGSQLNSFLWNGILPTDTSVQFQFAVSDASSGPWSYIGPNGTDTTVYTALPNSSVALDPLDFPPSRYFRYKVFLNADEAVTVTPVVTDIIVNWSR